jgi:O-antigen ligase
MNQESFVLRINRTAEFSFLAALFILPFAKAGFEIFFGATLAFWILSKVVGQKWFQTSSLFLIVVGLFVMSSSVSAFYSGYPETAFRGILKLLKYILVMLMAVEFCSSQRNLKRLLAVGLLSFGFVLTFSLLQNFLGHDPIFNRPISYANEQIRLTGPYQSYGLLAIHIIASAPIIVGLMIYFKGIRRIGFAVMLLAAFYVLYQTHSRGSWLALFGAFVVYSILIRHKWFLIILLAAVLSAPFLLPKKALFHPDIHNQEQSIVERKLLWKRALSVIEARPWFGCGINTFTINYPKYTKGKEWDVMRKEAMSGEYANFGEKEAWRIPGHPDQLPGHYVHNGYLQIAAETGLVSLAFFFAILGFCIFSGFHAFKKASEDKKPIMIGLISGVIALLLHALVDTTFSGLQAAVFVWIFLGLLVAVDRAGSNG